jgi:uncharacterized protein (DUF433 family)
VRTPREAGWTALGGAEVPGILRGAHRDGPLFSLTLEAYSAVQRPVRAAWSQFAQRKDLRKRRVSGGRPSRLPGHYPVCVAFERITVDPAHMGGLPCIRGMRVTVSMVLGQLAAGQTIEQVLADYPDLERADVLAALEYAARDAQEREVPLAPRGTARPGVARTAAVGAAAEAVRFPSEARAESQTISSGPNEVGLTVLAQGQGGSFQQQHGAATDTHALSTICRATSGENSALNVVSDNPAASALQVTGKETGRGSIKVSHIGAADGSDPNASGLSISLQTAGTAAQGIFLDAPNGTMGALLQLRNSGQRRLRVLSDGRIQFDGPATIGAAEELPASPDGYFRFLRPDGRTVKVPYYLE